jgi:hypothetical protein
MHQGAVDVERMAERLSFQSVKVAPGNVRVLWPRGAIERFKSTKRTGLKIRP